MVFSAAEIEQFVTDGMVMLRGGFSREVAARGREAVWNRVFRSWDKCTTSAQARIRVSDHLAGDPFDRLMNPRLSAAFDQLMGKGRWTAPDRFGHWLLILPGFEGPGKLHVDGMTQHRLVSAGRAVATTFLFSDLTPGDSGLGVVRGSHHAVARLIAAAEPGGLSAEELQAQLPAVDPAQIVYASGEAGDVVVQHRLTIHQLGRNAGNAIRFTVNPVFSLKEPLKLERPDRDYSPVEQAIRVALSQESGRP